MRSVCVFCGSSDGAHPIYLQTARDFGTLLAQQKVTLVYGGAKLGLMGAVADAALQAGGRVVGIMPQFLVEKEKAHRGLTDLQVVQTMHERKARMAELSECFIALPGGFGTLEEFFEAVTWMQLGLHRKPCGILNIRDYYSGLLQLLNTAVVEGFMREEHRAALVVETDPFLLLKGLQSTTPPSLEKWINSDQM